MLDGFLDASELLRGGVYVLVQSGRVMFVGKTKTLLGQIAEHKANARKSLPAWFPTKGVVFDQILVYPCFGAEMSVLADKLILHYKPPNNPQARTSPIVQFNLARKV